MTIQQYGDGYEIVWLPDGSQLVTTTAELSAADELGFAIEFDMSTDLVVVDVASTTSVQSPIVEVQGVVNLSIINVASTTTIELPTLERQGENDFSNCSNCQALYRFETGALTTDSKNGVNTLTNVGLNPVTESSIYKEGSKAAEFDYSESPWLGRTDTLLGSGFPLKSGESNDDISVCFWYRPTAMPSGNDHTLISKFNYGGANNLRSFAITLDETNDNIQLRIGHTGGTAVQDINHGSSLTVDQWYHVGVTFNGGTGAYKIRIWDDTESEILGSDLDSTYATNSISITTAPFAIGSYGNGQSPFTEGIIDEVVIFNTILSFDSINDIRRGLFSCEANIEINSTDISSTTTTQTPALTRVREVSIIDVSNTTTIQSPSIIRIRNLSILNVSSTTATHLPTVVRQSRDLLITNVNSTTSIQLPTIEKQTKDLLIVNVSSTTTIQPLTVVKQSKDLIILNVSSTTLIQTSTSSRIRSLEVVNVTSTTLIETPTVLRIRTLGVVDVSSLTVVESSGTVITGTVNINPTDVITLTSIKNITVSNLGARYKFAGIDLLTGEYVVIYGNLTIL